jgi:hypothetical protein
MPFASAETLGEPFDENLDPLDEGFDEQAEFLPLLPMIGAGGQAIGNVISGVGRNIGNLFSYRPNAPVRPGALPTPQGVQGATVTTPQGQAQIRLPSPVVTREELQQFREAVQTNHNQLAGRVNTIQNGIGTLASRAGVVAKDVDAIRVQASRNFTTLSRMARDTAAKLEKQRKETDDRINMVMMMSLLTGQGGGDDDDLLMLLPMMMMGSSSGSGDSMMPMMMALALMNRGND